MLKPVEIYPQPNYCNRISNIITSGSGTSGDAEEIAKRAETIAREAANTANRALNAKLTSDYSDDTADLYIKK